MSREDHDKGPNTDVPVGAYEVLSVCTTIPLERAPMRRNVTPITNRDAITFKIQP